LAGHSTGRLPGPASALPRRVRLVRGTGFGCCDGRCSGRQARACPRRAQEPSGPPQGGLRP
jgi:hypothetical protein